MTPPARFDQSNFSSEGPKSLHFGHTHSARLGQLVRVRSAGIRPLVAVVLQAAHALADEDGRVTILHVKETVPNYAIAYVPEDHEISLMEAMRNRLSGLAARLKKGTGVLVEGHSGRTIVEWAEANAVDCIIISSHRPGLQDYFLGSTAGRVVRHAQCSVHVMR